MSTFYLTVNGGTDLLMMDGTNIWAFQTGSVEGPPGTYTITPSFDTTLFDLPSDIDVYYSLTGGATWVAAGYDPITNPTFDVTASVGTTLLAQLRYTADGSAVQRLNESNILEDVPTVSLVLGSVAPTFDGTPSASATDPTVGDSVSVLTYAASGTPAPTVTFEWFVDAVSQAETTDTFDTTGLSGGETLTCTVTASNGVSPDATANVNFGTVAAAGPTLVIHDAFGGSGGLSGRTPDTVNNGNTWTTYNGETYSVSGGIVAPTNDLLDYSKTADIDIGTSTYTVEGFFNKYSASVSANGLTIAVSSGTDGSETLAKFEYQSGCRCVEYSSGSASVTSFGGLDGSSEIYIVLDVTGTSVDYAFYQPDMTTVIASGTHILSISAANRCGVHLRDGSCDFFKVYA